MRAAQALVLAALAAVPNGALAGGLEIPAPGTRAVGRGGAVAARPDNPMTLFYNPAGLALTEGIQLTLQTHLTLFHACFDRAGDYGDNVGPSPTVSVTPANQTPFGDEEALGAYPEVCNSGRPTIVPNLALSWRVNDRIGLSFGILAPSGVGVQRWGDSQTIGDRTYIGLQNGLPAPTRYMLVEEEIITAFPTIGIGVAVHPRLSLGLAFGWGIASFGFKNFTRAQSDEAFLGDVLTDFTAQDFFVPRITASVHATPIDALDLSFTAIWTDKVRASGDLNLQSAYYDEEVLDELSLPDTRLVSSIPLQLLFGARYGHRREARRLPATPDGAPNDGQVHDPMLEELFDIELNIMYERNSSVDSLNSNLPDCVDDCRQLFDNVAPGHPLAIPFFGDVPLPDRINLPQRWKDQLSIRLGGDVNVLPGRLAIRAGFTYETMGVTNGFQQISFTPFQRFGIHLGATARFGRFDLSLGYGHLFQQTQNVSPEDASVRQVSAAPQLEEENCINQGLEPDCSTTQADGQVINAGRTTTSYDTFSLGLTYHFR